MMRTRRPQMTHTNNSVKNTHGALSHFKSTQPQTHTRQNPQPSPTPGRTLPNSNPSTDTPTSAKVPTPHLDSVTSANSSSQAKRGRQAIQRRSHTPQLLTRNFPSKLTHPKAGSPTPAGAFLPPGLGLGSLGREGRCEGESCPGALFGKSGRDRRGGGPGRWTAGRGIRQ